MSSKTRVRNWGAKTNVVIILASIVAVLFAAALVTAFAVQPPTLGWVGFGIVSMIAFGLGALATVVVPRMRVSAPRPAAAVDEERRLLVVADAHCGAAALCDRIQERLDGAVSVHLVVPVRVSHLHFLANDEAEERRDAKTTTVIAVELLRGRGILATATVGADKPLESMTDALGAFPATHVLLALPPEEESYWLERDLLEKAQALTELPVTQVVVPSTPPAESTIGRTHTPPTRPEELPLAPSNGRNRQTIQFGRAAEARGRKERTS